MIERLKKGYLIGLGLASLTREKVEEVVDELVRRGEVAEKDRPNVIDDLISRMKEEQKRLSTSVKETAQKVVAEMGLPSRQQYQDLLARVEKLEQAKGMEQTPPVKAPEVQGLPTEQKAPRHDPTA